MQSITARYGGSVLVVCCHYRLSHTSSITRITKSQSRLKPCRSGQCFAKPAVSPADGSMASGAGGPAPRAASFKPVTAANAAAAAVPPAPLQVHPYSFADLLRHTPRANRLQQQCPPPPPPQISTTATRRAGARPRRGASGDSVEGVPQHTLLLLCIRKPGPFAPAGHSQSDRGGRAGAERGAVDGLSGGGPPPRGPRGGGPVPVQARLRTPPRSTAAQSQARQRQRRLGAGAGTEPVIRGSLLTISALPLA